MKRRRVDRTKRNAWRASKAKSVRVKGDPRCSVCQRLVHPYQAGTPCTDCTRGATS